MAYQYSTQEREQSPTLLPDFETMELQFGRCPECQQRFPWDGAPVGCQEPGCPGDLVSDGWGFFYAWLDGGLDCWSSDPIGPFATEAEAIAAARAEVN